MKYLLIALLLTCGCGEEEGNVTEIKGEKVTDIKDCGFAPEGFKIPSDDQIITKYGWDIEIKGEGDKFRVTYNSRGGSLNIEIYKVGDLGEIRPTPKAMKKAGYESDFYFRFY